MRIPVTDEFVRIANAPQLHREAGGGTVALAAAFVQDDGAWFYDVQDENADEATVRQALAAHVPATPTTPDDDLAARIKTVHDDPQVSVSVKRLAAALLGLNGEAAVAGRPTDR